MLKRNSMTQHENFPSAEQRAKDTLKRMSYALAEAKSAVDPKNAELSFQEVFPEPSERRTDTEFLLPKEQEEAFRNAMAKLGIGRETNLQAHEAGLRDGYVAVVEGGLGHKIASELHVVLKDEISRPSAIIVTATPDRKLPSIKEDKAKERDYAAKYLGIEPEDTGTTEYEVAQQIVESLPGFNKTDLSRAYAAGGSSEVALTVSDQPIRHIGSIGGGENETQVFMMPIIREYLEDGRYIQPGTREVLKTIDGALRQEGEDSDIGFVTSSTYQPSRETDAVSVMLELSRDDKTRHIGVITYGMAELASVKKEPLPEPPKLGQLATEAYKAAKQAEVLRKLLNDNQ